MPHSGKPVGAEMRQEGLSGRKRVVREKIKKHHPKLLLQRPDLSVCASRLQPLLQKPGRHPQVPVRPVRAVRNQDLVRPRDLDPEADGDQVLLRRRQRNPEATKEELPTAE